MDKVEKKFHSGHHSTDQEIERAFDRTKEVYASVKRLKLSFSAMQQVSSKLRDMSSRATGAVMSMRDALSPVIDVYVKLDDVSKYVNENLPEKMNTVFERVVMSPIDEWLKSFESMFKTERLAYMEAKLKFDHYTQKLQKLKASKHQKEMKGKRVGGRTTNKLNRNEEKHSKAEKEYDRRRKKLASTMAKLYTERHFQLNQIVLRYIQYQSQFAKDTWTAYESLEKMSEDLKQEVKKGPPAVPEDEAGDLKAVASQAKLDSPDAMPSGGNETKTNGETKQEEGDAPENHASDPKGTKKKKQKNRENKAAQPDPFGHSSHQGPGGGPQWDPGFGEDGPGAVEEEPPSSRRSSFNGFATEAATAEASRSQPKPAAAGAHGFDDPFDPFGNESHGGAGGGGGGGGGGRENAPPPSPPAPAPQPASAAPAHSNPFGSDFSDPFGGSTANANDSTASNAQSLHQHSSQQPAQSLAPPSPPHSHSSDTSSRTSQAAMPTSTAASNSFAFDPFGEGNDSDSTNANVSAASGSHHGTTGASSFPTDDAWTTGFESSTFFTDQRTAQSTTHSVTEAATHAPTTTKSRPSFPPGGGGHSTGFEDGPNPFADAPKQPPSTSSHSSNANGFDFPQHTTSAMPPPSTSSHASEPFPASFPTHGMTQPTAEPQSSALGFPAQGVPSIPGLEVDPDDIFADAMGDLINQPPPSQQQQQQPQPSKHTESHGFDGFGEGASNPFYASAGPSGASNANPVPAASTSDFNPFGDAF